MLGEKNPEIVCSTFIANSSPPVEVSLELGVASQLYIIQVAPTPAEGLSTLEGQRDCEGNSVKVIHKRLWRINEITQTTRPF